MVRFRGSCVERRSGLADGCVREPPFAEVAAICRRDTRSKPCYTDGMGRLTGLFAGVVGFGQLAAASSCVESPAQERIQVRAVAMIGSERAECGRLYSREGKTFGLADARMYLSGIEVLRQETMVWEPVELEDNPWQSAGIVLMDFENAQGACSDFGTPSVNSQLVGMVPEGRYIGLRFSLGLPPERNHIDPTTVQGPLGEPGMFWTWQAGYKFVKVDVKVEGPSGTAPVRNNIHLGSTGCASPAPMMAPSAGCTRPNLAQVTLFPFDVHTQQLELALDSVLGPALAQSDARALNCMGGPSEPVHCEAVVRSFGLDPQSGRCLNDCAGQTIFGTVGGQS